MDKLMVLPKPESRICNEMEELEQLLSLDGKEILELGCGKAEITRVIATSGCGRRVTATEVDKIQHANNVLIGDLPNVSFLMAGADNIPLGDEIFDVVFMFKSLHHVQIDLMGNALKEINRVLKPEGIAYISEPVFDGDFNEVLRIFHDEEQVRDMAYKTIKEAISNQDLLSVKELFFNVPVYFGNFEEFERKIIKVTHSNHELSPELLEKVNEEFLLAMEEDGARFLMPIRVNVLKKPSL